MSDYDGQVTALEEDFVAFTEAAKAGKEGRGSKGKALEARKLSMTITTKLKEFRTESIANDRQK